MKNYNFYLLNSSSRITTEIDVVNWFNVIRWRNYEIQWPFAELSVKLSNKNY